MGLRGSGKSTLAKAVGKALHLPVIDLDRRTLRALNHRNATSAFQALGEPAFRDAEAEQLRLAIAELEPTGGVLALGGGSPTAPGADKALQDAAKSGAAIVYLRGEPGQLTKRLSRSGPGANRPSLTGADPIDEITTIFNVRDPLYRSLATFELPMIDGEPLADNAQRLLGQWPGEPPRTLEP